MKDKHVSYNRRGDKIEVRLLNSDWEVYFKKDVSIHDKKGLRELFKELKNYNVKIEPQEGTSWFD